MLWLTYYPSLLAALSVSQHKSPRVHRDALYILSRELVARYELSERSLGDFGPGGSHWHPARIHERATVDGGFTTAPAWFYFHYGTPSGSLRSLPHPFAGTYTYKPPGSLSAYQAAVDQALTAFGSVIGTAGAEFGARYTESRASWLARLQESSPLGWQ